MTQFRKVDQYYAPAIARPATDHAPGWAAGLRQLYGNVAQEQVPADLQKLLACLRVR